MIRFLYENLEALQQLLLSKRKELNLARCWCTSCSSSK